ncbi:MAG: glycosyl hydrolase family 88 [Ruminococcaceae bacterium]|nr:glycosyl hydrolase family 88 [Oscillospiraceae bacterium]
MLTDEEKSWIDSLWGKLDQKLSRASISAYDKIPYTTVDGVYDDVKKDGIIRWTNGFWPGLMWLMYVGTGKDCYKKTARHAEELLDEAFKTPQMLHHDVGFMWHISSGVNYRLTKDKCAESRNYLAAQLLAARYNPECGFICAWNGKDMCGWTIVDSMMNLPLLYWASEEYGDPRYRKIAEKHADWVIKKHLREDGSLYHIVCSDPDTGEFIEYRPGGGYDVNGSWSRGHGWALYGFTLSYIHTKEIRYLETAEKIATYVAAELEKNGMLPVVDFKAPEKPCDSTAGAILACGFIELAKATENYKYLNTALKLIKVLEENFCDWSEEEQSVLQHGVESYFPEERQKGHHIIYGDYYFAEAVYKLKGFEPLFW